MNFISLYCRFMLLEELRILSGLRRYIPDANFMAQSVEVDIENIHTWVSSMVIPPGPAFGWGYYYDSFVKNVNRWLE